MGKAGLVLAVLALGLASRAARADGLDDLKGRYGFDWFAATDQSRCLRIDGPLLRQFKSEAYSCDLTQRTNSASGAVHVVCTKADQTQEFLIFETKAQCQGEWETQDANGD